MSVLEIKNLHVQIEDKKILKGVDLVLKTGEIHALMGQENLPYLQQLWETRIMKSLKEKSCSMGKMCWKWKWMSEHV